MSTDLAVVGTVVPRMGLVDKVQGKTRYTADLKRPGMLYGCVLRSPHAHARIINIDVSEATRLPGVHAVLTYRDVPAVRIDADLLPLDAIVRFVGDEVAVVAAESETLAEDALRLIRVEYEVQPAVFDAEEALRPDAPSVHEQGNLIGGKALVVERGNVAEALTRAARVFEGTFRTQIHAPVGMETRAALAEWQGDALTVWKTSRAVHANDRQTLARVLGIPPAQVRVICTSMGGGFGNKDESRLAVLVALLARQAGRPVRLEYSRAEEFIAGRNRQSSLTHLRLGVEQDGTPTAIAMRSIMNAGAHVASGMGVTRRTGQGALYLYTCPHARFEGLTVYTNRPAGGSFRGLGAPLGHFALEVLIDQVADGLGMDPLDYRLQCHVTDAGQPGQRTTPSDQLLPAGPVEVHIGNVDVGQGSTTVLAQMAAEALEVPVDLVDMVMADTALTPPAPITAGSSTTITCGTAVKLAAEDAKRHLLESAATLLQASAVRVEAGQLISAEAPQRRLDLA